jgi:hypothetical protein
MHCFNSARIIQHCNTRLRWHRCYVVVLLIAVFFDTASAQINSGTLVILEARDTNAIIAADSRNLRVSDHTVINDNYCKIIAVKNKFLFAQHGTSILGMNNAKFIGDTGNAVTHVVVQTTLSRIVRIWENANKLAYDALSDVNRRRLLMSTDNTGEIGGGVFALLLDDGSIAYAYIGLNMASSLEFTRMAVENGKTVFLGDASIANLFSSDIVPSYVREIKEHWTREHTTTENKLIAVVQATIDHTQSRTPDGIITVGGHVNEAQLTSHGVTWLTHNPECNTY